MTPIAASELIVTPAGAIYHLDLRPEQIADTIITVGDPARVNAVSKYFDRIEHQASHREFVTHTGYIGSKRLSVVSTGIGPDNIDIVFNELDALVNIDFNSRIVRPELRSLNIIRLGTSGALQVDIPVDSMLASSLAIGLDNLMHYYDYQPSAGEKQILSDFTEHTGLKSSPVAPYIAEGSMKLRSLFADRMTQGITVTCPGFYGPQGRILRAPLAFPQLIDRLSGFSSGGHRITNFEMETSAIYGLGKLLGHHCLSISAIIANRLSGEFSKDAYATIDKMIVECLEIISAAE